jgi:hypothetical protein
VTREDETQQQQRDRRPPPQNGLERALRHARRVIALVVGVTVALFGALLLFLPGPGLLGIAIGLAILASEFEWARLWMRRIRRSLPGSGRGAREADS